MMNLSALSTFWIQTLVVLALQASLIAGLLLLILRADLTARWRRTWCQIALLAMLVVGAGELAGADRRLAVWLQRAGNASAPPGSAGRALAEMQASLPSASGVQRPKILSTTAAPVPLPDEPVDLNEYGERSKQVGLAAGPGETEGHTSALSGPGWQNPVSPATVASPASPFGEAFARSDRFVTGLFIVVIWTVGAAFVAGRVFLARLFFFLFGLERRKVTDTRLLSRIQILLKFLRLNRSVRVVESRRLTSPIAFGVVRPTVGLPVDFARTFNPQKQDVILLHELAHLAARDPFWYWLADLATALFWWHPAVWWLRRQLQLASEWAADEASSLVEEGPRTLAESLVQLGVRLSAAPIPGQLRIEGFRSHLGLRVERLLKLPAASWVRPQRGFTTLTQGLVPVALTSVLIICTAWTWPRAFTKGENMKTAWKQSLAALGLIAGITANPGDGAAQTTGVNPRQPTAAAAAEYPGANPANAPQSAPATSPDAAFRKRYGLPPAGPAIPPAEGESQRGAQLKSKLKRIVLDEVRFDSVPLAEVVRMLSQEAGKRDSDKNGINFLLNSNMSGPGGGSIDPATGLPLPPEPIDLDSVVVRLSMPLRNITMLDVLEAIVRVADKPIQYAIEDYAVIFSPRSGVSGRGPQPPFLGVRTFKVDTNTFAAGLESAFGIKISDDPASKQTGRARKTQAALGELMKQLGINLEQNKAVFYNELTGVVMVRATEEDLQVMRAAIETLGGSLLEDAIQRDGYRPFR